MLASAGALLLAALAAGTIVAAKPGAGDRQRIVRGWLVEDLAEEDGGRLVRISRTSGPWRLEYHAAYWRGNDGVIQRVSALGPGCGGDEELDRHLIFHVVEIRKRLTAALAQCPAPPRAVRAALRGLEPAYALARAWDWERAIAEADRGRSPADLRSRRPEGTRRLRHRRGRGGAGHHRDECNAGGTSGGLLVMSGRKAPRPPTSARCAGPGRGRIAADANERSEDTFCSMKVTE